MTEDYVIGSVTGTATFERVEIGPSGENTTLAQVVGVYGDDMTTYETDRERIFIGGLPIEAVFDNIQLRPPEGQDFIWVEATETELRITKEKPV